MRTGAGTLSQVSEIALFTLFVVLEHSRVLFTTFDLPFPLSLSLLILSLFSYIHILIQTNLPPLP